MMPSTATMAYACPANFHVEPAQDRLKLAVKLVSPHSHCKAQASVYMLVIALVKLLLILIINVPHVRTPVRLVQSYLILSVIIAATPANSLVDNIWC